MMYRLYIIESEVYMSFFKTRELSKIYVVRIHKKTKHGFKYIQAVEHTSLKNAKNACELLSKYPEVEYCDFIELYRDSEYCKNIVCEPVPVLDTKPIIDWDTLNNVYKNSDRSGKSFNELIQEEFKK